jgi:hypothetical protein
MGLFLKESFKSVATPSVSFITRYQVPSTANLTTFGRSLLQLTVFGGGRRHVLRFFYNHFHIHNVPVSVVTAVPVSFTVDESFANSHSTIPPRRDICRPTTLGLPSFEPK